MYVLLIMNSFKRNDFNRYMRCSLNIQVTPILNMKFIGHLLLFRSNLCVST